jgi:protein-disulfide isomerase-like protein with CxxC motif
MIKIRSWHIATALALCLLPAGLLAADLKPKTTAAFDKYVMATEQRFASELKPGGPFLYIDELSADKKQDSFPESR